MFGQTQDGLFGTFLSFQAQNIFVVPTSVTRVAEKCVFDLWTSPKWALCSLLFRCRAKSQDYALQSLTTSTADHRLTGLRAHQLSIFNCTLKFSLCKSKLNCYYLCFYKSAYTTSKQKSLGKQMALVMKVFLKTSHCKSELEKRMTSFCVHSQRFHRLLLNLC